MNKKQNLGGQAEVSRDREHSGNYTQFTTVADRQAQVLASRFYLSPWLARDLARLCFGEGRL